MSFKLTLMFDNYEELIDYFYNMEKCKRKKKKENKSNK